MRIDPRSCTALTGLKGIISLVILWFHTVPTGSSLYKIPLFPLIPVLGGKLGNSTFFMVSGLLMGLFYQERIQSGKLPFGEFLHRRLRKFYPIYLLTNLASMAAHCLHQGGTAINLAKLAITFLMQGGTLVAHTPYNLPTWFINVLLMCNIFFFGICLHAKYSTAYRCALAAMLALGFYALIYPSNVPFLNNYAGIGILNFFLGCTIAEVYPCICPKVHNWARWLGLPAMAGIVYLIHRYGAAAAFGHFDLGISWIVAPLILYLAMANPAVNWLLCTKPLQGLGKISSSIFFWHLVVYDYFEYFYIRNTGSQVISDKAYLLYHILLFAVSVFSYHCLEKRLFRNLGKARACPSDSIR